MAKTVTEKRPRPVSTIPAPTPAAPAAPAATSAPATPDVQRLAITLMPDGRIAWDRMRESTRAQLLTLVKSDPRLMAPATAGNDAEIFTNQWIDMILDALGQVEVAAAVRLLHATPEQANVLRFSPTEKTTLYDPLRRVLNKYGGPALLKYSDEVQLLVIAGGLLTVKVQLLKNAMQKPADVLPFPGQPDGGNTE